jgi:hypothetical protein
MPSFWQLSSKISDPTPADTDTKVKFARESLDARVQEIVSRHFDPVTGCPFRLDYPKRLDRNPRREIPT